MDKSDEFLYNAITNVQDLIKYTENKAALIISIVSAYVLTIFLTFENIIVHLNSWSPVFWIIYVVFILLVIFTIWVNIMVFLPITNPERNLVIQFKKSTSIKFFLPINEYKSPFYPIFNSHKHKLSCDCSLYFNDIKSLHDGAITDILCQEFFKLSYIRNIKSDRFNILVYLIILTGITMILFYLTYQTEHIHLG